MDAKQVLGLLKADATAYCKRMLDEVEHARDIESDELRFAATTAAATAELFIRMIDKYKAKL